MKRFLTAIFCCFLLSATAQEAKFKQFYKAHKDKTAFSLNVSSSFASSFFDDEDEDDLKGLIKKSSDFKLMVFNNEDNVVSRNFKRFSKRNNLKTIFRAKDKDGKAEIFFLEKNDYIREIIVRASGSDNKLVLFGLKTKLTKDELAAIISSTKEEVASR